MNQTLMPFSNESPVSARPPARSARSARWRSLLVALLGLRLLVTGTGCDSPDTCDLGAAACIDNIAMNCAQATEEGGGMWQRRDCGTGRCLVTDDNTPQAVCTTTSEPDPLCADYDPGAVVEHQRCADGRVIECLGAYRQSEIDCAGEPCQQWEEETPVGSRAVAACTSAPQGP